MQFVENEVKEIGPGVWVRIAVDNISWCDLGAGAAVIDALEDPAQADVVRSLIRETTGQDLKWVVTTHWDGDHIACNPQWRREGALVFAHQSCADSAGDWEGRPDIAYSERASLRGARQSIDMIWAGGTHTPWDTLLHFPQARVLHVGDLFGWGLIPCKPTPEKIGRLHEVLDLALGFDADAVICGHGPTCTSKHLRRFVYYLAMMLNEVPELMEQRLTLDQIEARLPPPPDMVDWWRFTDWKHRRNIEMIAEYHEANGPAPLSFMGAG